MVPISTEPTLADAIARHEQDASLTPNRRRDLKSAVLRMSEITGVDPRITPAARATRRRFLETFADSPAMVIPAHFPTPTAGWIQSHGGSFRFHFDRLR
jgi:hypothetical protein